MWLMVKDTNREIPENEKLARLKDILDLVGKCKEDFLFWIPFEIRDDHNKIIVISDEPFSMDMDFRAMGGNEDLGTALRTDFTGKYDEPQCKTLWFLDFILSVRSHPNPFHPDHKMLQKPLVFVSQGGACYVIDRVVVNDDRDWTGAKIVVHLKRSYDYYDLSLKSEEYIQNMKRNFEKLNPGFEFKS